MYLLNITDLIAHLHPALVHLPIGILLIGLILQWLSRKEKFLSLRSAIPVVLLLGTLSAVVSCITGFILFRSSDYDRTLVSWHMWMALALTFTSFALFARSLSGRAFDRTGSWLGAGLFLLVMITGHLGGSLTHGEGYLSGALDGEMPPPAVIPPIANVQEALVYDSIVRPILQTHCYSCHGPNKQKGGLRLDDVTLIRKGGKDGAGFIAGHADSSELIKRMVLPDGDEHHMPPKDHHQPSRQQKELLSWWIDQGADVSRRVKDLAQPEKLRPALLSLQAGVTSAPEMISMAPEKPVEAADAKAIAALRNAGVAVMPLAQGSNYLSVDLNGASATSLLHLLLPVRKQLVRLDLSNTAVGDSSMDTIGQLAALRSLSLSYTHITDKALASVAGLSELRVLNLVGTAVTGKGLLAIQPPEHLHAVYLYRTRVERNDWNKLTNLFKGAVLDSGGYVLPKLSTDTAIVRPAIRK